MTGLSLAGQPPGQLHVCVLAEGAEAPATLLAPFLREGLAQGERALAIAGPASLEAYRHRLQLQGTACDREAMARVCLLPWIDSLCAPGRRFDSGDALESLASLLRGEGDPGPAEPVRIVEEMDWLVSATGGGKAVLEYELGVDRLVREQKHSAVCVYDVTRLSAQLLIGVLEAHPLAISRGQLFQSPFYRQRP